MIDTKAEAFKAVVASGRAKRIEDKMMEQFSDKDDRWTREDLAILADIKVSSVCGAVGALIKQGKLKRAGTAISQAGVTVQTLGLA